MMLLKSLLPLSYGGVCALGSKLALAQLHTNPTGLELGIGIRTLLPLPK